MSFVLLELPSVRDIIAVFMTLGINDCSGTASYSKKSQKRAESLRELIKKQEMTVDWWLINDYSTAILTFPRWSHTPRAKHSYIACSIACSFATKNSAYTRGWNTFYVQRSSKNNSEAKVRCDPSLSSFSLTKQATSPPTSFLLVHKEECWKLACQI